MRPVGRNSMCWKICLRKGWKRSKQEKAGFVPSGSNCITSCLMRLFGRQRLICRKGEFCWWKSEITWKWRLRLIKLFTRDLWCSAIARLMWHSKVFLSCRKSYKSCAKRKYSSKTRYFSNNNSENITLNITWLCGSEFQVDQLNLIEGTKLVNRVPEQPNKTTLRLSKLTVRRLILFLWYFLNKLLHHFITWNLIKFAK